MKRRKRVVRRRKGVSIQASARPKKQAQWIPPELAGMYRPLKEPVTLRLDADVLAWFKKGGRGYQTRINRALREWVDRAEKRARE
jgi:uncharacterized protein (DUF4415 family)